MGTLPHGSTGAQLIELVGVRLGYEVGPFSRSFADGHERNPVVCVSGRVPQSFFLVES